LSPPAGNPVGAAPSPAPEQVVVLGHGALAFVDLDEDTGLVVGVCGEYLRGLARDGFVALDQLGHDPSRGLDSERQRGNIEQQDVAGSSLLNIRTTEDGGLDSGSEGDGLVGVDGLAGLLAVEELLDHLLDLGDAGGASDQDDLVDVALGHAGVLEYAGCCRPSRWSQ